MKKKYNRRIFSFCFALIIICMLSLETFAYSIDYDQSKDVKFKPTNLPVLVTHTSPIFQIPNAHTMEFEISTLFPMGALYISDLRNLELMYFETVYTLNSYYSDGVGGYGYYWEGYRCKTSTALYALAVADYTVNDTVVEIDLGIKRVNDNSWLYMSFYDDYNNSVNWDPSPTIWYTPEITVFQGPQTEKQELAERLLRLLPVTSLYEEGTYPTDRTSYEMGYQDGLADAQNEAIKLGYEEGRAQGYAIGYTDGYNANENSNPFKNLINAVIFTPINAVMNMLNFDLFGVNMKGMILTLLTALIVIAVIVILWKKVT